MAIFYFDPSKAADLNSLKEGPNVCQISGATLKAAQSGSGDYLEVELLVDGVTIKDRFTTANINPTAVKMGLGKLKLLYAALGLGPCDVSQMFGRRCIVILEKKVNEQSGKGYFEPAGYEKIQGQVPQQQAQRQPPQQQARHTEVTHTQANGYNTDDVPF
jgi:hypothetical protein